MQRFMKAIIAIMLLTTMLVYVGCNKQGDSDVRVTTYKPQDITQTSAKCGGDVIVTQGLSLNELGVCWSTERNPTASDSHLSTTNWSNPYVCTITNLEPSTEYHVRAYALRGLEYYYGDDKVFTTLESNDGGGSNQQYTISVLVDPIEGGTVSGGGFFNSGTSCTVMAFEHSGYSFKNWTDNGMEVSTNSSYSFIVTSNRGLVAHFQRQTGNYDYIDLGLPSGTLWASCNVGASIPEEYGDYFAWGETSTKTTYTWSTYKYANGNYNKLTKYCNNSNYGNNGYTDNLIVLLAGDDAASANWGDGWRMPTKAEWEELKNNTTITWTTQNDVNGRCFTASNGNSLFLPAAGYRNEAGLCNIGGYGDYWSSSLSTDGGPYDAWTFSFGSDSCTLYGDNRNFGQSVRAVRSVCQN